MDFSNAFDSVFSTKRKYLKESRSDESNSRVLKFDGIAYVGISENEKEGNYVLSKQNDKLLTEAMKTKNKKILNKNKYIRRSVSQLQQWQKK